MPLLDSRARRSLIAAALLAAGAACAAAFADTPERGPAPRHGIAMYGEPALPAGFAHFPYADPAAKKGGRLVLGMQGTFDSMNPFIVKGVSPQHLSGLVVQSLMARSRDEPFTVYAQLAESAEMPEDRSWITFRLDPRARFSDGAPVTAEDVIVSFEMLKAKGRPNFRSAYGHVRKIEALDARTIRYDLAGLTDREVPLILALMPVFQKASIDPERFDQTSYDPFKGSGPYVLGEVRPGQSFSLKRNPDYWGADLPASRGLYNFDEVRVEFFRDANTLFEAFKAGLYDLRLEADPIAWQRDYDVPAVREGRIVRETLPLSTPRGMSGFVLNTRRPLLADVRVREALSEMFDFEWINRNLFAGAYARMDSFFPGSEFAAIGRPASPREREWLAAFPGAVKPGILDGTWQPPTSDGSGRDRRMAQRAFALLKEAGFEQADGVMREAKTGAPLAFEILAVNRQHERIALIFAHSLQRIGIEARVRLVDELQYWKRLFGSDFDVTIFGWAPATSPGSEQAGRWSSTAASRTGSINFAGVRSPAVDAMIERLMAAREREEYVDAVRALDRALTSGSYVIPLFYLKEQLVARAKGVRRPAVVPSTGLVIDALWRDEP